MEGLHHCDLLSHSFSLIFLRESFVFNASTLEHPLLFSSMKILNEISVMVNDESIASILEQITISF